MRNPTLRLLTFLMLAGCFPATGCCIGPAGSCAPVRRGEFVTVRKAVDDAVEQHMTLVAGQPLVHVGHKLGAYMEYPHHICADGVAGGLTSQVELMDRSFVGPNALDALELDVHPAPLGDRGDHELYVVHDHLDRGLPRARYEGVSLRTLLAHFRQHYAGTRKRLFIELKPQRTCSGKPAVDYGEEMVAERMMALLADFPQVVGQISLTSFSTRALEVAHSFQLKTGTVVGLRYYLIVGTTGAFMGTVGCWFSSGDIPRFDVTQDILRREWLTGVWFSPTSLPSYARTLNTLNESRKDHPLRFMFSYYGATWNDVVNTFGPKETGLRQVEGVIYDLCDKPDACPTMVVDQGTCDHRSI